MEIFMWTFVKFMDILRAALVKREEGFEIGKKLEMINDTDKTVESVWCRRDSDMTTFKL